MYLNMHILEPLTSTINTPVVQPRGSILLPMGAPPEATFLHDLGELIKWTMADYGCLTQTLDTIWA